ncbi:MAG: ATP-binding cassette domain-containing protein [Veillonella parvula]
MGPSGSGKSTFMNILGCLDRPTTGFIPTSMATRLLPYPTMSFAYVRNKQIGFVFQSFNLLTKLTA